MISKIVMAMFALVMLGTIVYQCIYYKPIRPVPVAPGFFDKNKDQ